MATALAYQAVDHADGMLLSVLLAEVAKTQRNPYAFLEGIRSEVMGTVDATSFGDDPDADVLKHGVLMRVESIMRASDSLLADGLSR